MNRLAVAVIVAAVGVFGAVYFFARDPSESPAAATATRQAVPERAASQSPTAVAPSNAALVPAPVAGGAPGVRTVATDPRLAALMGSPGDDLVELIPGPDGRVIREMDADPNSAGFRKPLREYAYAGDKVAMVTVYRYFADQTQIIRAMVTYKADGSVDQYREDTRYEQGKPGKSD